MVWRISAFEGVTLECIFSAVEVVDGQREREKEREKGSNELTIHGRINPSFVRFLDGGFGSVRRSGSKQQSSIARKAFFDKHRY